MELIDVMSSLLERRQKRSNVDLIEQFGKSIAVPHDNPWEPETVVVRIRRPSTQSDPDAKSEAPTNTNRGLIELAKRVSDAAASEGIQQKS